jgi:excisionase family DNA binding protein
VSYFTRAEDGSIVEALTAAEVMACLQITRTRLYELTAHGDLPYHKLPTGHRRRIFYLHELEAWLDARRGFEGGNPEEISRDS